MKQVNYKFHYRIFSDSKTYFQHKFVVKHINERDNLLAYAQTQFNNVLAEKNKLEAQIAEQNEVKNFNSSFEKKCQIDESQIAQIVSLTNQLKERSRNFDLFHLTFQKIHVFFNY